jgi:hypothetical protein
MHDLQKVYIEVYSDDDCERIHAVTVLPTESTMSVLEYLKVEKDNAA